MRRTSADFAREAKADDPWEYTIKGRKTALRPKALCHFSFSEKQQLNIAHLKWSKAVRDGDVDTLLSMPADQQPLFVSLRIRFGKDFDGFWAEASDWPEDELVRMIRELDEHYDPPTTDDSEAAADPESEAGKAHLTSVGS